MNIICGERKEYYDIGDMMVVMSCGCNGRPGHCHSIHLTSSKITLTINRTDNMTHHHATLTHTNHTRQYQI